MKTPFWSTDELKSYDTGETLFKVPKIDVKTHFNNSFILRYEAQEVRRCLQKGNHIFCWVFLSLSLIEVLSLNSYIFISICIF